MAKPKAQSKESRTLTKEEIKKFYPKDKDGNPILASGMVTVKAIPRK